MEARDFIIGTDWWTDCDDVVAMRILARAAKEGKINIKGIAINACMEYSVASLDGFLNLEKLSPIPIGIDLQATDYLGKPPYQKRLAEAAVNYKTNDVAPDAVRLYRKILAQAKRPVEIIEIGFLQVIAGVLDSGADDISDKTGIELFEEKVSKIWVMAGKWDEANGRENNFCQTKRASVAADIFCRKCPAEVTFLGFEIGEKVITGDNLDKDDFLYRVLCDHGSPCGRMSWDPMLALMAITGSERDAGYNTVCGTAFVNPLTGENSFSVSDTGRHKYVVKNKTDDFYKNLINNAITRC